MKYQTLEQALIERIQSGSGVSETGQFLPERELAAAYGVSRNTVRKAVSELCRQGYLTRIHGKGTFVKQQQRSHPIHSVTRCGQNYQEMGFFPSRKILCQQAEPASQAVAERLQIRAGEPVLLLKILYQADRMLLNETISYLPLSRFPQAERLDFAHAPLLEILYDKYGARPQRTENYLEAIHPPLEVMEQLKVPADLPMILFDAVTSGSLRGEVVPFEYFRCYYRTDSLRFSLIQQHTAAD